MKALVVNCSAHHYNLGASKLADWLRGQGYSVTTWSGDPGAFSFGFDLVCLSVIFSWHAPIAKDVALRVRHDGADVWCGGPGMTALAHWWKIETGLDCTPGVDPRFDHQQGDYRFTFASRGCPVGCTFCVVPKLEGLTFTLDWDFRPAPILCDNNLSALPDDFQRFIIDRYESHGVTLKDCNSGFEPRTFGSDTYLRWRGKFKGPWRFAYDETREGDDVARMMRILADEKARRKQVYVLIGNESIASCYDRAMAVIAWGGEPYVQPRMRLNVLTRDELWVSHDWTPDLAWDFQRYFNRHLWRHHHIRAYKPRVREPEPFRDLVTA